MVHIILTISLLFFPFTFVCGNHFRGGTTTWKLLTNNVTAGGKVSLVITQTSIWTRSYAACNDTMIADQYPIIDLSGKAGTNSNLTCIIDCNNTGGYIGNEVPVLGYCTDYSMALDLTVSQRSDIVNLTVGAQFTAAFATGGGWQTLALGNSAGWSISAYINLVPRADNGLINTPPVATCISFISIQQNVPTTIQIPVIDADNDFLRCRFANDTSECVNACPPGSLPPGTTLSTSCVLNITGPTANSYYLVAAQVEDFLTNTSTARLSSVPIQFLVYVYATPTCTLKPILVSDRNNDDCQAAMVGTNFTIEFTAINQCGSERSMVDIATLSFPGLRKGALVQNSTNTSVWSMTITWVPVASQIGSQVLCALAADNATVQSDQYCLRIFVGSTSQSLCPGAIVASSTMMTTLEMTTESETSLMTTEVATSAMTTMEETSEIITKMSTTTKESKTSPVNLPLIISIAVVCGALLLLLCTLCCVYFFGCRDMHRRTNQKKRDQIEEFTVSIPINDRLQALKETRTKYSIMFQTESDTRSLFDRNLKNLNDMNRLDSNVKEASAWTVGRSLTSGNQLSPEEIVTYQNGSITSSHRSTTSVSSQKKHFGQVRVTRIHRSKIRSAISTPVSLNRVGDLRMSAPVKKTF